VDGPLGVADGVVFVLVDDQFGGDAPLADADVQLPTQAEHLYVSVRKQEVPAKLVVYQDEHHEVGDPERAIHRLEALLDWFERHDPTLEGGDAGAES
jgi:hypothetical protein